jgi:hypothetical protein
MKDKETVELIIRQIEDPAVKTVALHALEKARKALDMSEHTRIQFVVDEIHKIMPKALKIRSNNETA